MESLHKKIQLMLEFVKAPFLILYFSYYTLMTFLTMLFLILLSMLMTLLSILSVIRHLICSNNLNWLLNLSLICETLWTEIRGSFLMSLLEKLSCFLLSWSHNNSSIDVKMDGSVLEEKSTFKMLGLTLSPKLDWGSCIISIAKSASKKIGAVILSLKFLFPEFALYLYKSTICPCIKYCCHLWAGAHSSYWEL